MSDSCLSPLPYGWSPSSSSSLRDIKSKSSFSSSSPSFDCFSSRFYARQSSQYQVATVSICSFVKWRRSVVHSGCSHPPLGQAASDSHATKYPVTDLKVPLHLQNCSASLSWATSVAAFRPSGSSISFFDSSSGLVPKKMRGGSLS